MSTHSFLIENPDLVSDITGFITDLKSNGYIDINISQNTKRSFFYSISVKSRKLPTSFSEIVKSYENISLMNAKLQVSLDREKRKNIKLEEKINSWALKWIESSNLKEGK